MTTFVNTSEVAKYLKGLLATNDLNEAFETYIGEEGLIKVKNLVSYVGSTFKFVAFLLVMISATFVTLLFAFSKGWQKDLSVAVVTFVGSALYAGWRSLVWYKREKIARAILKKYWISFETALKLLGLSPHNRADIKKLAGMTSAEIVWAVNDQVKLEVGLLRAQQLIKDEIPDFRFLVHQKGRELENGIETLRSFPVLVLSKNFSDYFSSSMTVSLVNNLFRLLEKAKEKPVDAY